MSHLIPPSLLSVEGQDLLFLVIVSEFSHLDRE